MNRFKVLIAPLILILTVVFVLSLIGAPKPSFEKIVNKKPKILPSDAEILEYNQEEKWEIELGAKLSEVEELVVEAVNVNDFKSYKKSKSPVRIKRKDEKIVVIKKKDTDEKVSDVIIAIAKPKSEERVFWKKSYLVHLKPRAIFIDSENQGDRSVNDSERVNSDTVKLEGQAGSEGEEAIANSDEFIFGRPKPSPSPDDSPVECDFEIHDHVVDGYEDSSIDVHYYPIGSKILSASISNVKATNKRPINLAGTSMSFTKNLRQDISVVDFVTKNAKWYGVNKGTKKDNICYFHEEQSEYEARIRVKIRRPDGKTCELDKKHKFIVRLETPVAFALLELQNMYQSVPIKITENTSRRCCVEIQPHPSPILAKTTSIGNLVEGQYKNYAQKEEERHVWQYLKGPWDKGGFGDEPNNKRVYSKLKRAKHCAMKRFFSKGGASNLCTRATGYARNALRKASSQTKKEFIKWGTGKEQSCWMEYTVKRDLGYNHFAGYVCSKAAHKLYSESKYPAIRGQSNCPLKIKQPAFLPPVKSGIFGINEENKQ